jgi:hypothetical protein
MPRWLTWTHGALLALMLAFWGILFVRTSFAEYSAGRDFLGVYLGAKLVATGHASQLYNLDAQRQMMDAAVSPLYRSRLMPFIYPPYIAMLFFPLGKVSLPTALVLWTSINVVITALLFGSLWPYHSDGLRSRSALLFFVLAWIPLHLTILQGQLGLLPTVGLAGAIFSLRKGRQVHAGLWLALGVLKPQLVAFPLLVLALWRCWRTLVPFFAVLAVLSGVSVAKLGFWIPKYFAFIREYGRLGEQASLYPGAMQNWRGLVFALLKSDSSSLSSFLLLLLSTASLVALLWMSRDWTEKASSSLRSNFTQLPMWELRFAIAILLGALSSPHLYLHDWVVALPGLTILLFFAREKLLDRYFRGMVLLVGVAPFVALTAQFSLLPGLNFVQLMPWYMALIVVVAMRNLRCSREDRAPAVATSPM